MPDDPPQPQDEDRVSLAPLDAETALRALLAVDPEDEPADESEDKDATSSAQE